jgi:hypothetical protein
MANVKQIMINGWVPYACHEDTDFRLRLADLHMPLNRAKFEWTEREIVKGKKQFHFSIIGQEAIPFRWLEAFANTVARIGGEIITDETIDIEA